MDFEDHVEIVATEGRRLAAVAELGLEAPVPSCPGWSVADVVAHTGAVYRVKAQILSAGLTQGPPEEIEEPGEDVVAGFRTAHRHLVDALTAAGPSQAAWTWYDDDQTSGFWARRMAHESVIHRVDVELAHEVVTVIDPEVAADGVDELVVVFMTGTPEWSDVVATDRTLRLESADTSDRWDLRLVTFSGTSTRTGTEYVDEPSLIVERFDSAADIATVIRAPAEPLDRFLWGRGPSDLLEVDGDATLVDKVRSIAVDVTQ